MKFLGVVGARIIVCVLLFIFIMFLSNLTLFQLFEFIARPFKKMKSTFQNIREENELLDSYEEWEYDEEQEALQLANSEPEPVQTLPDYNINMAVPEDNQVIAPPDFGVPHWNNDLDSEIDIPIDGVIAPLPQPIVPADNIKKEEQVIPEEKTPEEIIEFDAIDAMVSQAVAGKEKNIMPESFADKAAKAEENARKTTFAENKTKQYTLPSAEYLNKSVKKSDDSAAAELKQKADMLIETLKSFGVTASIIGIQRGPRVTRYEVKPAAGVKVSKITNLADDIALNLAAVGIRIEPIPGKTAIGIEVH
ncbi:MAG: hypothetical protein IJA12_08530, partial [Oscillospiraceae bacterium]|nr:hypothetical protein [Oscillospiraceae bacterium]